MCKTCKIQWVDRRGNPTPDSNPAVGEVRCNGMHTPKDGYPEYWPGYGPGKESEWYPICEGHLSRLPLEGWEYRPYPEPVVTFEDVEKFLTVSYNATMRRLGGDTWRIAFGAEQVIMFRGTFSECYAWAKGFAYALEWSGYHYE
jgi:hypothetical protein